ncbi:MAG: pyridoxal phosphate-dependent aminotransferase [Pseudomonadota bacterium]|uniref:Aminotransferase n=1 Tax=Marinomonas communis TaxID=28254 RepID=A0A4R6XAD6_9GAMM|nr:pyridoxal phosphate-dependent aminotransferase [Marinomonas communis]MEC8082841.1 pyridoxal phosphate-dependent aminotransferase [Pseudomonadota bacterium]TDR12478.1 aspartate aminotransferase [Marinomonas communis]
MNYQSTRLEQVKSSPSMAVSQAAKQMVRDGMAVVDLSLGEPDFNTPEDIIQAAIVAMYKGQTRYTAPDGTPELKDAIIQKFKSDNALDFNRNEISVGNGAKQVIFNALMATLEEGDEVVILAPYFVSYPDMVKLHGGIPKVVACTAENNFCPTKEALQEAITEKTRWIIINTPSNPSGAILTKENLAMIGNVVNQYPRCLIMSDEIYEKICFDEGQFTSFGKACPELKDRTLIINGVSKSYAMTGWRIGYGAGPEGLIKAMNKLQSQSTTNPSSISQAASVKALTGDQSFVEFCRLKYQSRRDLMIRGLADVPELKAFVPAGAFYIFADCEALIGKTTKNGQVLNNDTEVATFLLREALVACVPGAAYGLEPFVRFSFATSEEQLEQALTNIKAAIATLK